MDTNYDNRIFEPRSVEQAHYLLKKNVISECRRCEILFYASDLIFCDSCISYLDSK